MVMVKVLLSKQRNVPVRIVAAPNLDAVKYRPEWQCGSLPVPMSKCQRVSQIAAYSYGFYRTSGFNGTFLEKCQRNKLLAVGLVSK